MKKILAVSGGIDSVVMLHQMRNDPDVVVAHFDHGIRECSVDDCDFVEKLAKQYQKSFFYEHAHLGNKCSEERARTERYAFLQRIAREQHGQIYTAHHLDDVIESIAINFLRGTGWRGLAPFFQSDIQRPLLTVAKSDIYRYATANHLSFRQDSTNTEDYYLRNRIRRWLNQNFSDVQKRELFILFQQQTEIRKNIESLLNELVQDSKRLSRALLIDQQSGIEILRAFLSRNQISLTRPQLERCYESATTLSANKKISLDQVHFLVIGHFYLTIS